MSRMTVSRPTASRTTKATEQPTFKGPTVEDYPELLAAMKRSSDLHAQKAAIKVKLDSRVTAQRQYLVTGANDEFDQSAQQMFATGVLPAAVTTIDQVEDVEKLRRDLAIAT